MSVTYLANEDRRFLTALELATVFEDCVDTLTALGNAVAAPELDIRTMPSILEDEYFNRPRYGGRLASSSSTPVPPRTSFAEAILRPVLPAIARLNSRYSDHLRLSAVLEQRAASVDKLTSRESAKMQSLDRILQDLPENVGQNIEQEVRKKDQGWMLQQHYQSKIYKRTWQSNKQTPVRAFDEMVKSAGLKRSNRAHKLQADIGAIKVMMADIFNELVQFGKYAFGQLIEHIITVFKKTYGFLTFFFMDIYIVSSDNDPVTSESGGGQGRLQLQWYRWLWNQYITVMKAKLKEQFNRGDNSQTTGHTSDRR
ncbi:hypothetical protein PoB_005339100 [Plakobranchus ocellatus]|uniref:Uncharacterized protein n=1 Tax=Plakobranchus ocellatus TaxID=259542 RepID=A0AAV4C291_9GAST|nr:hypothetical protein PoB_005339100 [Plakobranchus ocellatus]